MIINTTLNPNAHSLESLEVLLSFIEVLLKVLPEYGVHPHLIYYISDYYMELTELLPIATANAARSKK
jgi:hypothetical protein